MARDTFASLFDLLPIGAYRSTPDGRQLRANAALVRLNGYGSEAVMLAAVNDIAREWYVAPHRRVEFCEAMQRDGYVSDFISEIYRHRTRERIWVREHAHVVTDLLTGEPFYEGTVEDITHERDAQEALRASERRFRALTDRSQTLTLLCDADFRVQYASLATQAMFGLAPEAMTGIDVRSLVDPDDLLRARDEELQILQRVNPGTETVLRCRHADGGWRHLAFIANNQLDDSAVGGIVLNVRDATEEVRANERLQALATTDQLTGLPNRAAFEVATRERLARAATKERPLAMFFLDLDRFKLVNDALGHVSGDRILQLVASRLQAALPPGAMIARLGGDEFGVLLDAGEDGRLPMNAVATALTDALRAPFLVDDVRFDIGVSVGVSVAPDHGNTFSTLLKHADLAMFSAKTDRRGGIRMFDEALAQSAQARARMMADLMTAIDEQQITVHYQPQWDLIDQRITGVEALVRWQHPARGLLAAGAFVADAEDLGLWPRIGRRVMEIALADLHRWRTRHGTTVSLAINVSPHELREPRFVPDFAALLARYPGIARAIEIEVTESALVEAGGAAAIALGRLHALGVRLVLDDLGVAYASLSHLKRLSLHGVKLDRSFVDGLPADATDVAIAHAIVALADSLDLRLVAEGVETEAQRAYLLHIGCSEAQGYLLGRPMAASALEPLLLAHAAPRRGSE